jgi:hypothetical protein
LRTYTKKISFLQSTSLYPIVPASASSHPQNEPSNGKELSIRRLAIPGPLVGSPAFNLNMIPRVIIQ